MKLENLFENKLSKTDEVRLSRMIGKNKSLSYPGYFMVKGDLNDKLTQIYGIYTDAPEFKIDNKMKVKFNWKTQSWMVSS